jgi:hypothetical protein
MKKRGFKLHEEPFVESLVDEPQDYFSDGSAGAPFQFTKYYRINFKA